MYVNSFTRSFFLSLFRLNQQTQFSVGNANEKEKEGEQKKEWKNKPKKRSLVNNLFKEMGIIV